MNNHESTIITKYFNQETISELSEICDSLKITDNNKRADTMMSILSDLGFNEEGCGTNRLVVSHIDDIDNEYVFKIALDNRGIVDNNVEHKIAKVLAPRKVVTDNYENIGIISVAQKVETMTSIDMEEYKEEVDNVLQTLYQFYILNDVGPKSFMNWGIDTEGNVMILDSAYLCPVNEVNFKVCRKCGSQLAYNEDLSGFVCTDKKCKKEYTFGEVTGGASTIVEELGFETDGVEDLNNDGYIDDHEFEQSKEKDTLEDMGFIND